MAKSALAGLVLAISLLVAHAAPCAARCDPDGADANALATTERAIRDGCDCAGAASRREYAGCARGIVQGEVAAGRLPASCRAKANLYARRSTCGRGAAVTCCLRNRHGVLRRSAEKCLSTGAAACVSPLPHFEDACDWFIGCRSTVCGDGQSLLSEGEECDPPESGICDARCQFIATCGNGVIEGGEECDGEAACNGGCKLTRQMCCDRDDHCIGSSASDPLGPYGFWKGCEVVLGGAFSFGTCEGAECPMSPVPEIECRIGSCGDRPIDPLPLCCQEASGGCRDTVATTAGAIGGFSCPPLIPDSEAQNIDRLMLGTCGADGRCVAAN